MAKQIKITVSTGWAYGDHVEYWELPENWDDFSDKEKGKHLNECALAYLHEVCDSYAEVVDEDDE
jgi:hypothetical protein